ncbi:MAG: ABC transporter ATP-binding protein [Desulfobacula sp.]|jgi:iron complex transport system ATP-binding protein
MDLILECHNLEFRYKDQIIFKDISFHIEKGRFCAILGRNGSGKTTLIHCLNKILTPVCGRILILGKDITSFSGNALARKISLLPQEHIDIFPYKVMDVVVMGRAPFLKISERPGEADYQIAAQALKQLNVEHLSNRNFNRISGGERQIVLLARCLAQAADIMLLDEPTNHLDFNHQYHLLSSIRQLCRKNKITVVASMHDPNLASAFADDIIMIKNGRVMVKGVKDDVMTEENISALYDMDVKKNQSSRILPPTQRCPPIPLWTPKH